MKMSSCRNCGMPIIWLKTSREKNIPVDPVNVDSEYEIFDREKHTCHFDTCPERVQENGGPRQQKPLQESVLSPFLQTKLVDYINAIKSGGDHKQAGFHFLTLCEQAYDPAKQPKPKPQPQPQPEMDFDDDIPF